MSISETEKLMTCLKKSDLKSRAAAAPVLADKNEAINEQMAAMIAQTSIWKPICQIILVSCSTMPSLTIFAISDGSASVPQT